MSEIDSLALTLQPHYSHFNVKNRLLFTGHSHQAWPDTAFDGVREYLDMVAQSVDLKWGVGNCFLRFPKGCNLRPVVTGWFASFSSLDEPRVNDEIQFDEGHQRFATGTYDPVSQYRAAKVVEFFNRQGLTPETLSAQYRNQIQLLRNLFQEKAFNPAIIKLTHEDPVSKTGGFLSLTSPFARKIRTDLLEKDVYTDARGTTLRIGPAPYITEQQCIKMIDSLSEGVLKFKN